MDHKQRSRLGLLAIALIAACGFTVSSAIAEIAAAKSDVKEMMGLDGISWETSTAYRSARLVVSGPDGFRLERAFGPGDSLYLDFAEIARAASPNARYKYELVFRPRMNAADKALADEARSMGVEASALGQASIGPVSGGFALSNGNVVDRDLPETTLKDQVILDDLIVDGSLCVGFDCVNGESFGFDTIRLKENNLRIRALDTSTSASFPTNDWQITFNATSNGGQEKFSIDDIDGGRTPFTIEAGAPSHSLYTDDGGRIGLGTSTPVVELHVVDGDTPTLRLEQDGSSGFTPQTWDVAGNETNFFIRDVSNGSTLPFRIRPSAPTSSIDVQGDGDVGINTSSPQAEAQLHVFSDGSNRGVVHLERAGNAGIVFEDNSLADTWSFGTDGSGGFNIAKVGLGVVFSIDSSGNITCLSTATINGVACIP